MDIAYSRISRNTKISICKKNTNLPLPFRSSYLYIKGAIYYVDGGNFQNAICPKCSDSNQIGLHDEASNNSRNIYCTIFRLLSSEKWLVAGRIKQKYYMLIWLTIITSVILVIIATQW